MRTIEGSVIVGEHGEVKLDLPTDLIPGTHRIVVEVVEQDKEIETTAEELPQEKKSYSGYVRPHPERPPLPGTIRRTSEQIDQLLAKMFTPEELANIGKTDFANKPIGSKSITEIISELREDRLRR